MQNIHSILKHKDGYANKTTISTIRGSLAFSAATFLESNKPVICALVKA